MSICIFEGKVLTPFVGFRRDRPDETPPHGPRSAQEAPRAVKGGKCAPTGADALLGALWATLGGLAGKVKWKVGNVLEAFALDESFHLFHDVLPAVRPILAHGVHEFI